MHPPQEYVLLENMDGRRVFGGGRGIVVAVAGYKGRTKEAGSQGNGARRRQAGRLERDDGTD